MSSGAGIHEYRTFVLLTGGSLLKIPSLATVKLLHLRTEGPGPARSPTWHPATCTQPHLAPRPPLSLACSSSISSSSRLRRGSAWRTGRTLPRRSVGPQGGSARSPPSRTLSHLPPGWRMNHASERNPLPLCHLSYRIP